MTIHVFFSGFASGNPPGSVRLYLDGKQVGQVYIRHATHIHGNGQQQGTHHG